MAARHQIPPAGRRRRRGGTVGGDQPYDVWRHLFLITSIFRCRMPLCLMEQARSRRCWLLWEGCGFCGPCGCWFADGAQLPARAEQRYGVCSLWAECCVFISAAVWDARAHTHTRATAVKLVSAPVTVVPATSSFPVSLTSLFSRLVFMIMIIIVIIMIFFRILHSNTPVVLKICILSLFCSSYSWEHESGKTGKTSSPGADRRKGKLQKWRDFDCWAGTASPSGMGGRSPSSSQFGFIDRLSLPLRLDSKLSFLIQLS